MCNFRVGQKVVCVDADDHSRFTPWRINPRSHGMSGLKEGSVYTVRAIGEYGGAPSVWLEEISRPLTTPMCVKYGECGFSVRRFRPVVSRKTDISIFTAMLNPSRVTVDVMNLSDAAREMIQ